MEASDLPVNRKAVLVVLFVPSVERDGVTAINQEYWVGEALEPSADYTAGPPLSRGPEACGAMTRWVASWSRMSPSSSIVIRRPRTSPIQTVFRSLAVSAGEWDARHTKAKSGW